MTFPSGVSTAWMELSGQLVGGVHCPPPAAARAAVPVRDVVVDDCWLVLAVPRSMGAGNSRSALRTAATSSGVLASLRLTVAVLEEEAGAVPTSAITSGRGAGDGVSLIGGGAGEGAAFIGPVEPKLTAPS